MKLTRLLKQLLEEQKKKTDRCKRIADRKYDKPSAYKSGAIVRCRKGEIWKDLKEEEAKDTTKKFIVYPDFQGVDPANISGQNKVINVVDALGNEPNKDYNYFTTEKKDYVDKMIQSAQNDGWKSFPPIIAIPHPLLSGKYIIIDGNHRLGAFKIGKIPQIKATVLSYDDILLAVPGTKWQEGKTPETITLKDAKSKGIDLKKYFTTNDLQLKEEYNNTELNLNDADEFDFSEQDEVTFIYNSPLDFDYYDNWKDERLKFSIPIETIRGLLYNQSLTQIEVPIIIYNPNDPTKDINGKTILDKKTAESIMDSYYENYPDAMSFSMNEAKKETLRTWFKRKGAPGKEGGWVDCNTCRNGKCKPCGRKEGEKRAKYPSCRPTPAQCKTKGKGKKWGKTK